MVFCSKLFKEQAFTPRTQFLSISVRSRKVYIFSDVFRAYSNFKPTMLFHSFVLIANNAENNLDQKNGWCYVDVKISWIRPRSICTTTANCAQITLKIACFITTYEIAWSQMQNLLCSTSRILLPKLLRDAVYYKGILPPVPLQVIAV